MYPSEGLKTALNKMREMSVEDGSIYHQYVDVITDSTTIGEFGQPILDSSNLNVMNDFIGLLRKVVATAVNTKTFNNPLASLEGERMPLGQFIEDTYVNPAKARGFNVNDFAGLLQKYEAEVAVQYLSINSDLQYCVTITRDKLRNAFTSWGNLESFVSGLINSLYNGAYITRYNQTKGLVLSAFTGNNIQFETVTAVSDEATANALVKKMRADFNKMQIPSTKFNAWNKVRGGNLALKTWSDPEDIIVMISADVEANVSVDVLARAFNMDKANFLGRVIVVDDFSQYNEDGSVAVDGTGIQAMIADRSWFKISTQDFSTDEFRNPNNRTYQYYLNDVRRVNYSLFANAKVYATEAPVIAVKNIDFGTETVEIEKNDHEGLDVTITPANATTQITYAVTSGTASHLELTPSNNGRHLDIKAKSTASGNYTITATAGDVTDTVTVTVA